MRDAWRSSSRNVTGSSARRPKVEVVVKKGYVSRGKSVVATGGTTATGKVQKAIYDHKMISKFTGMRA